MATIAHDRGSMSAGPGKQSAFGKAIVGGLMVWVILGLAIGVLYANHVIIQDWSQPAALRAQQQVGMMAWYSSNVLYNLFGGAIVWFTGIVVLVVLSWRTRGET
jgi:hypothetical protein